MHCNPSPTTATDEVESCAAQFPYESQLSVPASVTLYVTMVESDTFILQKVFNNKIKYFVLLLSFY